jgi:hypothetical protein
MSVRLVEMRDGRPRTRYWRALGVLLTLFAAFAAVIWIVYAAMRAFGLEQHSAMPFRIAWLACVLFVVFSVRRQRQEQLGAPANSGETR